MVTSNATRQAATGFERRSPIHSIACLVVCVAVVLGVLTFGIGASVSAVAAPSATAAAEPVHLFGWPSSGAPNDPYFSYQTDLTPIGVAAAWTQTTGSADVVVAVLDTGLDATNPEFSGRIVPGYNALTGAEDGPTDFAATLDDNGHGTHVSGTIAAAADNAVGIAGIAPQTTIMPVKVMDALGKGDTLGVARGLAWAIAHGARIVTLSLGGTLPADSVSSTGAPFDAAYAAGVVVIAAAGNDGTTVTNYPCNFPHVICVGSTTNDGSAVSSFSTRTAGLSLVAPGERIVSTVLGGSYQAWSGTSMATPHVTATVALMRAVSPSIGVDAVTTDLEQAAKPLVTGGRNPDSGFGLLQVDAAITLAASSPVPAPVPSPSSSPTASPSPLPSPSSSPSPSASPIPIPLPPDPNASPAPSPSPAPGATPQPTPDRPTITKIAPGNGARNVSRTVRIRITFSMPVDGLVGIKDLTSGDCVPTRVSVDPGTITVTVTPRTRLAANHTYRLTVVHAVSIETGIDLARPITIVFRTGSR